MECLDEYEHENLIVKKLQSKDMRESDGKLCFCKKVVEFGRSILKDSRMMKIIWIIIWQEMQ